MYPFTVSYSPTKFPEFLRSALCSKIWAAPANKWLAWDENRQYLQLFWQSPGFAAIHGIAVKALQSYLIKSHGLNVNTTITQSFLA